MTSDYLTGFFYEAIKLTILLSAPMLLAGLVIGLVVSIFQSVTSINEMTLTFIPKMLAVAATFVLFFPWMMQSIVDFTQQMFLNMNQFIR